MKPAALLRAARSRVWCPHTPHAKQRKFLDLACKEALYGGAAGGGKSDALLMAALQYVDVPSYSALLLRRSYADLALPGAIMDRAHDWLAGTAAKWDDTKKTWTFPSGATLTFGYLETKGDHYRYQGAEFQFCGFDELTQFLEKQYLYLFSRLRRLDGVDIPIRMRAASNPGGIGHDWVKARFLDYPAGREFVPATLDDNEFIDRAEYEEGLSRLDPTTFSQLRHGLWVRDGSELVYSCFSDDNITEVLPILPFGERWTYVLGCDFGVVDPTAYVVLAFTESEPDLYVVESSEWPGLAPSDAAERAAEWEKRYGGFERIVGDVGGMGKAFDAEWRKRFPDMPMHAAQKTEKLGYIKFLNGEFHHRLVKVVAQGNEKLMRDLRSLCWKDDRHAQEHPGMSNHTCDSLLYAWRHCRHFLHKPRKAVGYGTPEWADEERERRMEARRTRMSRRMDMDIYKEFS